MNKQELQIMATLHDIAVNLKHLTYTQVKDMVFKAVPSFPINTNTTDKIRRPQEDHYQRDSSIIFRTRPDDITRMGHAIQQPFQKLENISIVPPIELHKIPIGRCNLEKKPIFYSSNYPITACVEAASHGFTQDFKSTTVTMGGWQIIKPLNLAEITFSSLALRELEENSEFSYENIKKYRQNMKDHMKIQIEDDVNQKHSSDFNLSLLEFFSDQFGKIEIIHPSDYYLSNLYCDVIFNYSYADESGSLYDGIVYPSVRNALQEFNVALHPRAMGKIKFIGAEHIWITKYPGNKFQFDSLDSASLLENGDLDWEIFNNSQL